MGKDGWVKVESWDMGGTPEVKMDGQRMDVEARGWGLQLEYTIKQASCQGREVY